MNHVSRQKAISKVEKDFKKLMNNSNFGNDCWNNIDNCNFKVVYDDTEEISYIKKYASPYFDEYKDFTCPETMKLQIEQEYYNEILSIEENDPCADAKKYCTGQKRSKKFGTVESMISKSKRKKHFKILEKKQSTI